MRARVWSSYRGKWTRIAAACAVAMALCSACSKSRQMAVAATGELRSRVQFPPMMLDASAVGVLARGSWKAVSSEPVAANTSNIWCDPVTRECSVVTADYIDFLDGRPLIALRRNHLAIVVWNKDLIVAKDGTEAEGVTLTINVPTRDILWMQTNIGYEQGETRVPPSTMTLRLVDGAALDSTADPPAHAPSVPSRSTAR